MLTSHSTARPRGAAALAAVTGLAALSLVTLAGPALATPSSAGPALAAPGPSARSTAPQPVTFGIGPATNGKRDTRNFLQLSADPGARASDHVAVVNQSATPLTLTLYTTDATNGVNGTLSYRPKADPGNGAHRWLTLGLPGGATTIRVPARHTDIVPVSITVPQDATPGDHYAGVRVALDAKAATSNGKRIDFEQGVTMQVRFHVSGTQTPKLAVEHLSASYHGTANPFGSGSTTVSWTVHNTGNVAIGATQKVSVGGLFGSDAPTRALPVLPLLQPGSSVEQKVEIPGVFPAVHLHADVTLTPVAAAGEVTPTLAPVSASTGLWAVPWTLLLLVVVLVALALAALAWRRTHPAQEARHQRPRGGPATAIPGKA